MLYHNSNILLFYNVFDFALLTSISQSFNSYFFFFNILHEGYGIFIEILD